MRDKKQLTTKQQKNRNKLYSLLCSIGEYPCIVAPYAIMAGVNHETWFIVNPEPWKIGLGGTLGIILLGMATFLITLKKEKPSLTNGMISLIIGWYTVTFIFYLLAEINMEIYKIMAYGGLGLIAAAGLEFGSIKFGDIAKDMADTLERVKKEDNIEKAKMELAEEKEESKKKIVF